jgi:hypothetical protein
MYVRTWLHKRDTVAKNERKKTVQNACPAFLAMIFYNGKARRLYVKDK